MSQQQVGCFVKWLDEWLVVEECHKGVGVQGDKTQELVDTCILTLSCIHKQSSTRKCLLCVLRHTTCIIILYCVFWSIERVWVVGCMFLYVLFGPLLHINLTGFNLYFH